VAGCLGIRKTRVRELIRIAEGKTTQAEINARKRELEAKRAAEVSTAQATPAEELASTEEPPVNDDTPPGESAPKGQRSAGASQTKRQKQNAEAQARRREKLSSIREANGGKASKPRMDRETSQQYSRLAMMAKVLDAAKLQIVCDWIDNEWPGTEEKANKAKTERDEAWE
jgi:hypothetical protein